MGDDALQPWSPPEPVRLTSSAPPGEIVNRAVQLSERDKASLVTAFSNGSFEMAASYVWSRAFASLKKQLSSLGMEFVGEMLGRTDLGDYSNPVKDIRDDEAIDLAEQLGMINTTEALRLRSSQALLTHFMDPDVAASEEMHQSEAITVLRSCVINFLADPTSGTYQPFLVLRHKLEGETLSAASAEVRALSTSPYFFIRTTLTVLLAQLKTASGAKLEHAAGNINCLLPVMWPKLREKDKWQIGETYAIVQATDRTVASAGLRRALLAVKGFDFVPETLRSDTFRAAAKAVLDAHFGYNNFYNEPKPMSVLARLGSSVPGPAIADCFTAVLCVRLGNRYGYSVAAQQPADELISVIRPSQWEGYFNKLLPSDRKILEKIGYEDKPLDRWQELLGRLPLDGMTIDPRVKKLLSSGRADRNVVMQTARALREKVMQ